jgi:hypothetical protein
MSPAAIRLLELHKSNPDLASFPVHEMAMQGIDLAAMDDAYNELLRRGFVEQKGMTAINATISRPCYKITQAGTDAEVIRNDNG